MLPALTGRIPRPDKRHAGCVSFIQELKNWPKEGPRGRADTACPQLRLLMCKGRAHGTGLPQDAPPVPQIRQVLSRTTLRRCSGRMASARLQKRQGVRATGLWWSGTGMTQGGIAGTTFSGVIRDVIAPGQQDVADIDGQERSSGQTSGGMPQRLSKNAEKSPDMSGLFYGCLICASPAR